jgi:hypothetical protein
VLIVARLEAGAKIALRDLIRHLLNRRLDIAEGEREPRPIVVVLGQIRHMVGHDHPVEAHFAVDAQGAVNT